MSGWRESDGSVVTSSEGSTAKEPDALICKGEALALESGAGERGRGERERVSEYFAWLVYRFARKAGARSLFPALPLENARLNEGNCLPGTTTTRSLPPSPGELRHGDKKGTRKGDGKLSQIKDHDRFVDLAEKSNTEDIVGAMSRRCRRGLVDVLSIAGTRREQGKERRKYSKKGCKGWGGGLK